MIQNSVFRTRHLLAVLLLGSTLGLTACGDPNTEYAYPETLRGERITTGQQQDTVFGPEGMDIFGQSRRNAEQGGGGAGLGINSFLWRASLDTISFMPIASADPFGGVIITDWYTPVETPNERFKLNVFIMGRALRADGIKVSAFRQQRDATGAWVDTQVKDTVITDLENAVLTRARKMRIAAQAIAEQGR
jgi:hypothetical protein